MLTDAIARQDVPTWRLVPGLILTKFIPEKFEIFSIPHLLHKEDPITGAMVRVPIGSAITRFMTLQSRVRAKFPNQNAPSSAGRSASGRDAKAAAHLNETMAGTNAQLERAERMFIDILTKIDSLPTSELPTLKSEWIFFLDIGVEVLEHFATLAFGFPKGGAKIAIAHNNNINLGKFDPMKLWNDVATPNAFRHSNHSS